MLNVTPILAALLLLPSAVWANPVAVQWVDSDDFSKSRQLRFFFDGPDGLSPGEVSVDFDGRSVPGKVTFQTFEEANERFALAILLNGNCSYRDASSKQEDGTGLNAFALQTQAVVELLRKLPPDHWVAVYQTGRRETLGRVVGWTSKPADAAAKVAAMHSGPCGAQRFPPKPLAALKDLMTDVADQGVKNGSLPPRRLVLLVTDGRDHSVARPAKLERAGAVVVDRATHERIQIHAVGFSEEVPASFDWVADVSARTGGRFYPVAKDRRAQLATTIGQVGRQFQSQYVMTFTADASFQGGETPKTIGVTVNQAGDSWRAEYANVRTEPPPVDDGWLLSTYFLLGVLTLVVVIVLLLLWPRIPKPWRKRPKAS